ncbi:MAG: MFS transporter [Planctomycetes bacterium]|nr:MFS transporter [Planctomycetota bacterium]
MSLSTPSTSNAPPLALPLRINLSIMMFFQFAIWGSWVIVFFPYLTGKGFTATQAGTLMGNGALGAIIATIFAGYIADRYFSSEKMMAVLHLLGAGFLYLMATIDKPDDYWMLFAITLGYAILYNPTLALANSISFRHIPDGQRDFPGIRVLGTVGWIAAGFAIDQIFGSGGKKASDSNGPLLLAAGLSATLGVYSLMLPKTPPEGKAGDTIPFIKALSLFKDFSFAVFFIISFLITIVLAFYYTLTSDYIQKAAGVTNTGSIMSIGQMSELILLPFLPWFLYRFGMKTVLMLGMFCWGLRYFMFSMGGPSGLPYALVLIGIALHGVCFDFFIAAGFIHVDNNAPKDIRASGQALFSFLVYGMGMWIGSLLAGYLKAYYTHDGVTNWSEFWLVPCGGVMVAFVAFGLLFRGGMGKKAG